MYKKIALKMCLKQWNLGYQDVFDISQFPTLKNRRLYLKLCTLYKIMHGYFYFLPNVFLPQVNRRSLPLIHVPHARTNAFQSSFVPSTVSIWNNLPHEALIAPPLLHSNYTLHHCFFVLIIINKYICICINNLSL